MDNVRTFMVLSPLQRLSADNQALNVQCPLELNGSHVGIHRGLSLPPQVHGVDQLSRYWYLVYKSERACFIVVSQNSCTTEQVSHFLIVLLFLPTPVWCWELNPKSALLRSYPQPTGL